MMFHQRLKAVRKSMELTQKEFAELGGITQKTQVLYERGDRLANIGYLDGLASHGVDIVYLLTGIPQKTSAFDDDEKELIIVYRMANKSEKNTLKNIFQAFKRNKY